MYKIFKSAFFVLFLLVLIITPAFAEQADFRIQYTDRLVGENSPTYSDTLNVYSDAITAGAIGYNLLTNGSVELWDNGVSSAPTDWTLGGGGSVARSATTKRGSYSALVTYSASDTTLTQAFRDYANFQGEKVIATAWVQTATASIARIELDDGVVTTYSSYHTGGGGWELITKGFTVDGSATKLEVTLHVSGAGNANFDAIKLEEGEVETAFCPNPVESGRIVQIRQYETGAFSSGTTQIPLDDTIPQNTEGDEYMTLDITPSNVNNDLLVTVTTIFSGSGTGHIVAALFKDSGADAIAAAYGRSVSGVMRTVTFSHKIAAGTTSTQTFKVRIGPTSGLTVYFNGTSGGAKFGGVLVSSITITEIAN